MLPLFIYLYVCTVTVGQILCWICFALPTLLVYSAQSAIVPVYTYLVTQGFLLNTETKYPQVFVFVRLISCKETGKNVSQKMRPSLNSTMKLSSSEHLNYGHILLMDFLLRCGLHSH